MLYDEELGILWYDFGCRSTAWLALTSSEVCDDKLFVCIQPAVTHLLGGASLAVDAGLSPCYCQKTYMICASLTICFYPVSRLSFNLFTTC